jgi:ferrous iron transport protein B
VILLAYIIAIPANEIVIPTILMLTVLTAKQLAGVGAGAGVMFELDSLSATMEVFVAGGWTVLTGVNLMLFSLLHNPCSTTLYTIYKESGSLRWTALAALIPLAIGFRGDLFCRPSLAAGGVTVLLLLVEGSEPG